MLKDHLTKKAMIMQKTLTMTERSKAMKIQFLNQPIPRRERHSSRSIPFPDPQNPFFSQAEDQLHQMYYEADKWATRKLRAIQYEQTVEQNYIINTLFISIYKAACKYMSDKLAQEFTINLSQELKPKLIRLIK